MLISWNWLKQYVAVDVDADEVARRLTMAGLNHEQTTEVGDDLAIDLEVTSNRPDCLGHIGVAREVTVLWQRDLALPDASPPVGSPPVTELTRVAVKCPGLCHRYTARVIRGVRLDSSPQWLVNRLKTIGIPAINNVVDITNYVLMECGQPLHAFDLNQLGGQQIIVRESIQDEPFLAIDHKTYTLDAGMCVIADTERPVALGGVMGGADTEVSGATTDLLIESAQFDPVSVRNTARKLNLHSPSSYRFERGVDPEGVDWASRRCCELILELAGGELAEGVIDVGPPQQQRPSITLRLDQLPRILGIEIDRQEVQQILQDLGNELVGTGDRHIEVVPPSWRRDLSREIDLVEEVARIHGYEAIPEDARVPMAPSGRSDFDRVLGKIRQVLTASGFDEAMTYSAVSQEWSNAFSPWSTAEPLRCSTPMLRGADLLRRSLVPSLLGARQVNQSLANPDVELFETAKIYIPQGKSLPDEEWMLAVTSGREFFTVKGILEELVETLNPGHRMDVEVTDHPLLQPGSSCRLLLGEVMCGFLGEVSPAGQKRFGLRSPVTVAELRISTLCDIAELIPQHRALSPYPSISRDINLIVDESVSWAEVAAVVRASSDQLLEAVQYRETYRDPGRDGHGKKRLLFSVSLRSHERTLTNEEADEIRNQIHATCGKEHGAMLVT